MWFNEYESVATLPKVFEKQLVLVDFGTHISFVKESCVYRLASEGTQIRLVETKTDIRGIWLGYGEKAKCLGAVIVQWPARKKRLRLVIVSDE